ncbi:MAG: aldehyde dehydrogenase family protein [Saprospiraceae bacterium]
MKPDFGLPITCWPESGNWLANKFNCWLLRDLRTPFGGVKQSGVGREGGWEAMRFFTELKNVTVAE